MKWIPLLVLVAIGCGSDPVTPPVRQVIVPPSPEITPQPTPTAAYQLVPYQAPTPEPERTSRPDVTTRPGRVYFDFSLGSDGLSDVRLDGNDYPWLYAGNWFVAGGQLNHVDLRPQPNLSFRRYSGLAFGENGALPPRYRASVTLTFGGSYDAPNAYPPTGDQGVPFYYLDPTHYVELLIKPNLFEVWECDGGQPEKSGGWRRLYGEELVTGKGDSRTLGATVDVAAGKIQVYLDGAMKATVSSPLITPGYHSFALRAAGNSLAFDNLLIESL